MKRIRRGPHRATCRHCPRVRALGQEFHLWRASYDSAEEATTHGYATERAEFTTMHHPPTFRDYLIAMAGTGWPMSGQAPRRYHRPGAAA